MKNRITGTLSRWRSACTSEAGQGLAEYGLILALIALACVLALGALGQGIASSAGFVALPASY